MLICKLKMSLLFSVFVRFGKNIDDWGDKRYLCVRL